ncbi:hypothetical protein UlMin_036408 [Ulmus minor]
MAFTLKLFLFTTLLALAIPKSMARLEPSNPPGFNLAARLKLEDESSNCWDSLIELQACSVEVILFFLNGETNLGTGCCLAIRTIAHQCWPAMFSTIGFTTQEVDILQGYCDAETHALPSPPPPPSSPPSAQPTKEVFYENLVPMN